MGRPPRSGSGDNNDFERDPGEWADGTDWRGLFTATHPRVVLVRLCEGDPLEIEARCEEQLRELALLVPLSRAHACSLGRIAYSAMRYRGQPALGEFIRENIEQAVHDLAADDREELRKGVTEIDLSEAPYPRVAAHLGIEPALALRACVTFNVLDHAVRSACYRVLIEGRSIQSCVSEGLGPRELILSRLQTGLRALSTSLGRTIAWPPHGPTEGGENHAP